MRTTGKLENAYPLYNLTVTIHVLQSKDKNKLTRDFKTAIIEALVTERKRQKLTQADLAFRAGWDVSFVSKIERGFGNRATSAYQQYLDALGVTAHVTLTPETE